jgi:phosphoribosylformylglycinamidine cyclo-ligase
VSAPGASYAGAGVSIEAGDRAVALMKEWVDKATRPEVVGGIGGSPALRRQRAQGLRPAAAGHLRRRCGTKVAIAQAMDVHNTVGFDLVGMLVDDLVVVGASRCS